MKVKIIICPSKKVDLRTIQNLTHIAFDTNFVQFGFGYDGNLRMEIDAKIIVLIFWTKFHQNVTKIPRMEATPNHAKIKKSGANRLNFRL